MTQMGGHGIYYPLDSKAERTHAHTHTHTRETTSKGVDCGGWGVGQLAVLLGGGREGRKTKEKNETWKKTEEKREIDTHTQQTKNKLYLYLYRYIDT